ncbi:MAG: hypothetical protein KKH74_13625 [Gammaproteobacteria bacterium]|nr:hypothetical protein [Gammaproteobacteria bacterium]MBU1732824.1 hypothetical protein [Gammaproteobacteria bacterium]MBU1891649.1 hypothetical protein [Gammaproteobacteria bacterium]
MKTAEQMRETAAARKARSRAKQASKGFVDVRVTAPTLEAAAFIKELVARLREPGAAALDVTLARMLNVPQAPQPAPAPAPLPPAAPAAPAAPASGKPAWMTAVPGEPAWMSTVRAGAERAVKAEAEAAAAAAAAAAAQNAG